MVSHLCGISASLFRQCESLWNVPGFGNFSIDDPPNHNNINCNGFTVEQHGITDLDYKQYITDRCYRNRIDFESSVGPYGSDFEELFQTLNPDIVSLNILQVGNEVVPFEFL